ncbi:pirin family protein [Friedmanniella luteola]|uniref:pirin family protein n=1 Tax=Friedmanniella luteola TaxID=546871 RepID=UPI000B82A289|nr:pirin family protein [Friedmanniella luteola]
MSDLETRPSEQRLAGPPAGGPEELLLTARRVYLGKTTEVARLLPDRQVRMIGAWCFLDHYGPEDLGDAPGMRVWAHPHTGLQTVSWLLEGEIEHRDSLGSLARVRPGELHVMTAGAGIVHSELSPPDRPPTMHGLQLWVALPEAARHGRPHFDTVTDLPRLTREGLRGQVLLGEVDGVRSPAPAYSPLCAADLELVAGADVEITLDPAFEHGVVVVAGEATAAGTSGGVDQLVYLGTGRSRLRLRSATGARVMLLGGEPFPEEIVLWWNFIGRSHAEVAGFRDAWERREARFPPVVERGERVMEAPPLPTVPLKARPSRRVAR